MRFFSQARQMPDRADHNEQREGEQRMVLGPAAIGVRSLNTVEVGFAYGPQTHKHSAESASLSKPTGKPA